MRRGSARQAAGTGGCVLCNGHRDEQRTTSSARRQKEPGTRPKGSRAGLPASRLSHLPRRARPAVLVPAGVVVAVVTTTAAGRDKHAEAHRAWKQAQLALNAKLGDARVARLHELIDACLADLETDEDIAHE